MHKVYWFIYCKGKILLQLNSDGNYIVPSDNSQFTDLSGVVFHHTYELANGLSVNSIEVNCEQPFNGMKYVPLRQSFFMLPSWQYELAGKFIELIYWDKETQYCGRCGSKLEYSTDISKKCPDCNHTIWPSLQLAIIVLIKRGNQILLVQSRNFKGDYMGLLAGFVETGETLEQAVVREVAEETQLQIKNLRYIRSQAWPFPCNLMAGFVADYEAGEIKIQESELKKAGWFTRNNLPALPDGASIARQLIDLWQDEVI